MSGTLRRSLLTFERHSSGISFGFGSRALEPTSFNVLPFWVVRVLVVSSITRVLWWLFLFHLTRQRFCFSRSDPWPERFPDRHTTWPFSHFMTFLLFFISFSLPRRRVSLFFSSDANCLFSSSSYSYRNASSRDWDNTTRTFSTSVRTSSRIHSEFTNTCPVTI